jgi:SAM-dependent methyltransferase
MRGAGGVEPIWLPNPWQGGRVLMLGCGAKPMIGAVNHDRVKHSPWVDVAFNLEKMPWIKQHAPLNLLLEHERVFAQVDGFDAVYAYDLVEHIEDVFGFLNEIHALMKPGGILVMRGGAADNPATFIDPTHRHWFTEESMDFVDPERGLGKNYGMFYTDGMGRPLAKWHIDGVDRVNADPRWPATPDIQWTLVRL